MLSEQVDQADLVSVLVLEAIVLLDDRARRKPHALFGQSGEMSSGFDLFREQGRPCCSVFGGFVRKSAGALRGQFRCGPQFAHVVFLPCSASSRHLSTRRTRATVSDRDTPIFFDRFCGRPSSVGAKRHTTSSLPYDD